MHPTANSCPHFRVLVVDDNVDGAESLALILRRAAQEVQTAQGPFRMPRGRRSIQGRRRKRKTVETPGRQDRS